MPFAVHTIAGQMKNSRIIGTVWIILTLYDLIWCAFIKRAYFHHIRS